MKKAVKIVFFALFVFLIFILPCGALTINPNDYIQLKATKPAGVPLHREAKSSMFARLPDKAMVKVLQTTEVRNRFLQYHAVYGCDWPELQLFQTLYQKPHYVI